MSGKTPEKAIHYASALVDKRGRTLDPRSLEPVAALYLLGVPTTASCDGHKNRGYAYPWIDFLSPKSNGEFLLEELQLWTIVQRGQGEMRSYRLNPRQISSIDDDRWDHLSYSNWTKPRKELALFSREVLQS